MNNSSPMQGASGEKCTQVKRDRHGRFENPWVTWVDKGVRDVLKWKLGSDKNNSRVPSSQELDRTLPVKKPNFEGTQDGVKATWIGHASILFQLDSVRILCDPIFSSRCSPTQWMGPKRYRPVPCEIEELPNIDVVLISHTHYDHLDYGSVVKLAHQFPAAEWFVPMGVKKWMQSTFGLDIPVTEMDWWQETNLQKHPEVRIAFTPAQHWSARSPTDRNHCLWGSWAVLGPQHRVWFAGDSGYCEGFTQIGNKYGPFDMAAIPIGAYDPRWFMCHQHVDPKEAVQIHTDIRSKRSLGMHWGTFNLSYEHYLEPPQRLKEAVQAAGLRADAFMTVCHGETLCHKDDGSHHVD